MTLNKFYSLAILLIVSILSSNNAMAVELLRDRKFTQGFVFKLPDNSNEYAQANRIATHNGLQTPDTIFKIPPRSGEGDPKQILGVNRIGETSAVPPWQIYTLSMITTPYFAEKDHETSLPYYPLMGNGNCPSGLTGACIWEGKAGNHTIMSITAGRNLVTAAEPDFSVQLYAKTQFERWALENYWGACTNPALSDVNASWTAHSACFDEIATFLSTSSPGYKLQEEQRWPHFMLSQTIVGDAKLKHMTKLRISGKVKLNRLNRHDLSLSPECPHYPTWNQAIGQWQTPSDCTPWMNSAKDIGIRLRNSKNGHGIWLGVISSYGWDKWMEFGLDPVYRRIGTEQGDSGQGTSDTIFKISGSVIEQILSSGHSTLMMPQAGPSTDPNVVQLVNPDGLEWELGISDDGGVSNPAVYIPAFISILNNGLPANTLSNPGVIRVDPPAFANGYDSEWVSFGLDLYDIGLDKDWLRKIVQDVSAHYALNPDPTKNGPYSGKYSDDIDDYVIDSFAASLEIGDAVNEEIQFKDLSLDATYSETVDKTEPTVTAAVQSALQ